jgi:hypothetical protein
MIRKKKKKKKKKKQRRRASVHSQDNYFECCEKSFGNKKNTGPCEKSRKKPELSCVSMDANWRSAVRDLHVLSLSFFFVFLAYGAIQNLESSLLKIDGLGSTSLAVLYLSLTISSLGAPFVVMRLGSKNAILFALSGYWIFIVANLFPSW